jgi:hypothetical protein
MRAKPLGMRDVEGAALLDHCQAGLAVTFIMGRVSYSVVCWAGIEKAQSPVRNFGQQGWLKSTMKVIYARISCRFDMIRLQRRMPGVAN